MALVECDIAVVPETGLAEHAITTSESMQPFGSQFVLRPDGPRPHVSLYMLQLQEEALTELVARLAHVAAVTASLHLVATAYSQEAGYIDAAYRRSAALDSLQAQVLHVANPLRDGLRERLEVRLPTLPEQERDNVQRYGYRYVGESFRPHLTLTRFVDETPIDTASLPDVSEFNGRYVKLGLFEMGDNGTCMKMLAGFPLRA